ncbi:MAG: GAF domain-containing protein [Chloroflexi bacterium]|nr:MAG: GAF domain-containing protein [Chloroflexota bacterium]
MPATGTSTRPQAVSALREIARALSSAWDLDTTLDLIARKTTEVMHVDSCTIYLLDPDGEYLRLRASTGLAKRALGRATLRVGEGMTGYAVAVNEPIYAIDAQHNPHFKMVDEAEEGVFQSLLAVPLVLDDRPIGAMNVQTVQPHAFTGDEIEVLSLIGDLAAGALVKAQLYDQQRQQIEEMRALAQVSEVVTSPQYLDDMLDVVTSMAAQTMGAAVCSIFLLDESGTKLELRSAKRTTSPYRHRPPLALGQGVIGRVAQTGESVYIRDVREAPEYLSRELARAEGLASLLAVPLSVRDRVIGVLNCYTAVPRTFTAEQQAFFATLANQTALAIENARLVTNTAVIREMHHRIKNNLQTVAMLMQMQIPDAERLDTAQVLRANIHRIHSIAAVHEVLSERGFRLVEVKEVLERIARMTAEMMTAPGQQVEIRVFGDSFALPSRAATALALVVNELVQNALEHGLAGGQNGRIMVSLGRSPDELIVLVRDDGVGLPQNWERGLGLEIVETLVRDDLNGRIQFHRLKQGTEISVRIPREDMTPQ